MEIKEFLLTARRKDAKCKYQHLFKLSSEGFCLILENSKNLVQLDENFMSLDPKINHLLKMCILAFRFFHEFLLF